MLITEETIISIWKNTIVCVILITAVVGVATILQGMVILYTWITGMVSSILKFIHRKFLIKSGEPGP